MTSHNSKIIRDIEHGIEGVLENFNSIVDQVIYESSINEGSGGTPINALGAVPSKDRAKVDYYYEYYKNLTPGNLSITRRGMQIIITPKEYEEGPKSFSAEYDNTPNQPSLNEVYQPVNYSFYFDSILDYMKKSGMNIEPLPKIETLEDEDNAKKVLGKTGYYSPDEKKIVLYITGRHPKDILRSFCHEMIHHIQNIEDRLGSVPTTNTNEDSHLTKIEQEAHYLGSMTLRKWEDTLPEKENY